MAILSLTSDNKLKLQCSFFEKELAKKVSSASWDKINQVWLYPFSKDRVQEFRQIFSDLSISQTVLEAEKQEIEHEKRLLELKNLKNCDMLLGDWCKLSLFEHQKVAVNYLFNAGCAMLADDLGLGKSAISLIVFILRKFYNQIQKCLIVCPATTKYSVWEKEIKKFTNEKYLVIDGTRKERIELYKRWLDEDIFFLVVNYEALLVDIEVLTIPFSFGIIADETVYIKNVRAKRTKALKSLKAQYKIAVTGRPVANKIQDIFSQFDFIKPSLLGSWWSFQDRYLEFYPMKFGDRVFRQLSGYKNLDELKRKIEPYYIRRLKTDGYIKLPPKVFEEREVVLSGKLLEAYNDMKEEMRLKIKDMKDEEVIAKASTILTQMLRLSQLTSGFITDINLSQPYFFKENPKVELIDEIIDEVVSSNQKIVVWVRFRPLLNFLYKRYSEGFRYNGEDCKYNCVHLIGGMDAKIKEENRLKFQDDPHCRVFIGMIQAGGLGIDLFAAATEILTDVSFLSTFTVEQGCDRLHRIGQKKTVVIINTIAKKTIDEHWQKLLKTKKRMSNLIFEDEKDLRLEKEELLTLLE